MFANTRLAFALTVAVTGHAWAQDDTKQPESLERIARYELAELDEQDGSVPLELVGPSFLNWSNPVFGTTDGGLFVWVKADRPAAIMKTYKTKNDFWFEQIRSFSSHRLVAREDDDGAVFWSPDRGVDAMKPLPNAPEPAIKAPARLLQMKAIHRKFTVKGEIVNAGGVQDLRVYPRPLYRYKADQIIDGALLAFVQGTAPDMILMLEARNVDGQAKWFYRLGALGIFKVDVYYEDQLVWSEPRRTATGTKSSDIYNGRRLPK